MHRLFFCKKKKKSVVILKYILDDSYYGEKTVWLEMDGI